MIESSEAIKRLKIIIISCTLAISGCICRHPPGLSSFTLLPLGSVDMPLLVNYVLAINTYCVMHAHFFYLAEKVVHTSF